MNGDVQVTVVENVVSLEVATGVGPAGPAGPAGATGATGATGTTGATGATGAAGADGHDAIQPPVIAFAGDSIIAATIGSNTATGTFNTSRGLDFWARFLTGQRFTSRQAMNFGVAGNTTTQLLARLDTVIASGASCYFVLIGTNDATAADYATTTANLESIVDQLLATGAIVILSTILPRDLATQSSRDFLQRVNSFIRQMPLTRNRFFIVDPAINYVDPASATWAPRTDYSYDGLHPETLGAYFASKPLVAAIKQIYPETGPALASVADVFSADNPTGNLLTNGMLTGTGGTNGGGGGTISGSIAANWTVAHGANGGTITSLVTACSKVTLADGRTAQQFDVSGSATGAGSAAINNHTVLSIRQDRTSSFGNYSTGDKVMLEADIEVDAGAADISGIECQLLMTVGGTNYTNGDGSCLGDLMPNEAFSGRFRTEPFTIPSGTITLVRASVRIYFKDGAITPALTIRIAGIKLSKVS